ncbi:HAMP domain-containing protein [bacterium]|nr:HAMP domain-containing protein [bacterium]
MVKKPKANKERTDHLKSLFLSQSLSLKIIFYIGVILVIAISFSFYLNNDAHEKELINLIQLQSHRLTDTIKKTIRHNMINYGSHAGIQSLIETIGDRDDIEKVSILDHGQIKASSWREEVGIICAKQGKECALCHSSKEGSPPLAVFIHRLFKDEKGKRFIELFNPIQNEPVCYQCHPREKQILGILNIVTSLSRMDKSIIAGRKVMVISTIIIFLLVSIEIFYFIYRFVHCPIQKLTSATRRVAGGDIDYHIDINSTDEIGDLARSFNIMTEKLKKSWSEIEAWNQELEKRVDEATAKLKQANKELQNTNQRLQIADQKKADVLVTVAHDIRGPLAAIKNCIGVILGGYLSKDQNKQQDMLKRADQRVEELLRFTNNLLDLSLMEESWHDQKDMDCSVLIRAIMPEIEKIASKRDISVSFKGEKSLPLIEGDKALLSKAFFYIIENAIKYSHNNGDIQIELASQNGRNIAFMVVDQGIGIPEKEISCIFEPTFRGELARKHNQSGTGVSMALVERIINLHKGNIIVNSEEGKGTKVSVVLPGARLPMA